MGDLELVRSSRQTYTNFLSILSFVRINILRQLEAGSTDLENWY
jgi:hypothetical protein